MEFRLSYRGELKGNGDPGHKHAIRRVFHTQLTELWRQPPLSGRPELAAAAPAAGQLTLSVERPPYRFVPLVSTRLHATADLDIVLLRPGPPGHILRGGGDIDNRLKTLLDALKLPEVNALPPGAVPAAGEDPFYCLLEDDKLVTGIRVEADRFLDAANEREGLLLIRVTTKYTEAIWANIGL